MNEFNSYLKKMDAGFQKSQQKYEDEFVLFPACVTVFKLVSSEIGKRDNGSHFIKSKFVGVEDGDFKGRTYTDFRNLPDGAGDTETQWAFVRRWFHSLGFQAPESLVDLPDLLDQLIGANIIVKAAIKHNGEYANMTIQGLVETGETTLPETKIETKVEADTSPDIDTLIEACDVSGIELTKLAKKSIESIVDFIRDGYDLSADDLAEGLPELFAALGLDVEGYEPTDPDPETDNDDDEFLRTTANDLGADGEFKADDTVEQMVERMNGYSWETKALLKMNITQEAIDRLTSLGVKVDK